MSKKPALKRLRPRLLPVVMAAGAGLLLLKVLGLMTQGGYMLLQPPPEKEKFGRMLTGPRRDLVPDDVTGSVPPKKDDAKKDDAKKSDAGKDAAKEPAKAAEPVAQPLPPAPPSAAEKALYEKLGQRRQQLEDRAKELDLRESLLKSAEKVVDERLGELKELEAKADAGARKQDGGTSLKSLVVMYEAMKPRDAARVFEKMDARLLTPLARQMNPRKLSEVLALMSPEAAEKLTAGLMRGEEPAAAPAKAGSEKAPAAPAMEELPRLGAADKSPKS